MRAGASKVRVTTISRSDFGSTVVRLLAVLVSLSFLAFIHLLLAVQFLRNLGRLVEACSPRLAGPFETCCFGRQSARAELGGPHAPDLLCGHESSSLQDADVRLQAG